MINISNQQRKYIITPTVPEGTKDISYSIYLDNQVIYNGRCRYLDSFEIDLADFVEQEWDKGNNEGNFVINISYSTNDNTTTETITCPFEKETIELPVAPETGCDYMNLIISDSDFKSLYEYDEYGWVEKVWNYLQIDGQYIWKDYDGHIYYDFITIHKELVNDSWVEKAWGDLKPNGQYIWKDYDGHIYCSDESRQYELIGDTWENKAWGDKYPRLGEDVWIDGNHIYYSYYNDQYELIDGEWQNKNWKGQTGYILGRNLWHDNDGHIYCSNNVTQLELIGDTWVNKVWNGRYPSYGNHIWHDNDGHIYCSNNSQQLELINGVWQEKAWLDLKPELGSCIWKDNDGHIYSSYYSTGSNYKQKELTETHRSTISYDITIPLKVKSGILSGKTINNLDKITYTDRYGDRHNSAVSNKMEIECYVDDSWLKTFTGNDVTYVKLMSAIQSARNSLLTGNATISGMDITGPVNLKCRVKDIETIETYSVYSVNNKIPSYKITIEIYR